MEPLSKKLIINRFHQLNKIYHPKSFLFAKWKTVVLKEKENTKLLDKETQKSKKGPWRSQEGIKRGKK